ncbi:MAG TPA: diacylglycerol kinase family protein [Gaiella sp.]|nr:diacylglycerol kinase family protein [Gaiella sp.]
MSRVFLVNPASANGATGRRWAELERRAAALGLEGDTQLSKRPGHLSELATEAVARGATSLVVVGGDGTVHEVVDGVVGAGLGDRFELGMIPLGTGRDFARRLSIPRRFEDAVEVARGGRVRTVDVGRATYTTAAGEARAHFANFAGAGISGGIAARANRTSKALGGKISFFWATLAVFSRWPPSEMTVTIDGVERQARLLEALAMNGDYTAGGMWVAPEASLEDGAFDVVLIGDFSKAEFTTTFPKIYRGRHVTHPKVEIIRARELEVDAPEPLPIVLDGEQPGTTPVRFELLPAALRVRVPDASAG